MGAYPPAFWGCPRILGVNDEKQRRGKNMLKTKKHKNHVVCNPDSGLLVALGVPRSAFLANFQPAGASRSPPGLKSKKNIKTNGCVGIYVYIYVHIRIGIDFWNASKKWFPRLSTKVESLGN
jgi:hypothetical protein